MVPAPSTVAGLEAIIDAAAGVLAARSLEDTLEEMARALQPIVPYTSLAIYEAAPGSETLLPVLAAGHYVDETLADRPPIAGSIAGRAVAEQELQHVEPGSPLLGKSQIPGTPAEEEEALVSAPLLAHGRAIGALNVWREGAGASFEEAEADLIRRFATLAAMAWDAARQREALRQQALTDELTGLPNRRHFHERLGAELRRLSRDGTPVTLVLLDVDDFKRINDRHGHARGDDVLRGFAGVLRAHVRACDVVFRTGGEEFAAVLPGASAGEAVAAAGRLVDAVRAAGLHPAGDALTASAGVATAPGDAREFDALYAAADARLLAAKAAGKDRVVSA